MNRLFVTILSLVISCSALAQTVADARKAMSEKRYEDALRISQTLAERGDSESQNRLATIYRNGMGVPKDVSEGMRWLMLAVENNDPNALLTLGNMHFRGEGMPIDFEQALFWKKKAADLKSPQPFAFFDVAEMFFNGQGTAKNIEEAEKYYRIFLGVRFIDTTNIQQRIDTARGRLREIDVMTTTQTSATVSNAAGPDQKNAPSPISVPVSTPADDQATFKRVKVLALKGDPDAQVQLGNMYAAGQGVKQSQVEALKLYRQAAAQGNTTGQYKVGASYLDADGFSEALKWLQQSANKGNADAQVAIGEMYALGRGVPVDYPEAATWYRMAATQGNMTAQYALGGLYRAGRGVMQDDNEAIKWYQLAVDRGDAKSRAALDSMRVDMAARQRVIDQRQHVIDQQQRNIRAEETKRQQEIDARRQIEQQQEKRLEQERERARIEKEKCLQNATERLCRISCIGARGNDVYTCPQNCAERERANVAACNGVYLPPAQQNINIQQAPTRLPNPNACIQDGGSTMCMGR